jgi:hypothetical protein
VRDVRRQARASLPQPPPQLCARALVVIDVRANPTISINTVFM